MITLRQYNKEKDQQCLEEIAKQVSENYFPRIYYDDSGKTTSQNALIKHINYMNRNDYILLENNKIIGFTSFEYNNKTNKLSGSNSKSPSTAPEISWAIVNSNYQNHPDVKAAIDLKFENFRENVIGIWETDFEW